MGEGSVVIKTCHGGEVLLWDSLSVLLEDKAVGVSWVSNNDGLAISAGMIGHSFTNSNENLTIIFKKICTLHTWSSWLSSASLIRICSSPESFLKSLASLARAFIAAFSESVNADSLANCILLIDSTKANGFIEANGSMFCHT